jgi:hypothetical protein
LSAIILTPQLNALLVRLPDLQRNQFEITTAKKNTCSVDHCCPLILFPNSLLSPRHVSFLRAPPSLTPLRSTVRPCALTYRRHSRCRRSHVTQPNASTVNMRTMVRTCTRLGISLT